MCSRKVYLVSSSGWRMYNADIAAVKTLMNKTPIMIVSIPSTFPALVEGVKSPYPTPVIVTRLYQNESKTDKKESSSVNRIMDDIAM